MLIFGEDFVAVVRNKKKFFGKWFPEKVEVPKKGIFLPQPVVTSEIAGFYATSKSRPTRLVGSRNLEFRKPNFDPSKSRFSTPGGGSFYRRSL